MKIRTDFVTNSSSSSYCVSFVIKEVGKNEKICLTMVPYDILDEIGANFYIKSDINDALSKVKECESIDALRELIISEYGDEYREEVAERMKPLDDIKNVESVGISQFFTSWGEFSESCREKFLRIMLPENADTEDEETIATALKDYLSEEDVQHVIDNDEDFRANIMTTLDLKTGDIEKTITLDEGDLVFPDADCFFEEDEDFYEEDEDFEEDDDDGEIFKIKEGVLIRYKGDDKEVVIPDGVTEIGKGAFDGCDSFTSITIPDSVEEIGHSAFFDCGSLTSVIIPNGVTKISDSAFFYCSSLTNITIPDSVTEIDDEAFFKCESLTSITIPDGVTKISDSAFGGCDDLTIHAPAGSCAEKYAKKNKIKFKAI